ADGNRIDLTLYPVAGLPEMPRDSQSVLLLDKDCIVEPFPPPSGRDYLPKAPSAKAFADCCNEFWWLCPYVSKGLWRREIVYAKAMMDGYLRGELMKMLAWFAGEEYGYSRGIGKCGKRLEGLLEKELWDGLLATYSDADYDGNWKALFAAVDLFRKASRRVAEASGFEYPRGEDEKVSAYLARLRSLPGAARDM
ncbi:MAG: aminoglycoside 6-adenylyltransferase, partial [Spirochaetaceae bacterium]|nr:aminoglycoside 6-adenylyltransferase [Spirochaetaceae bacterium]